MTNSLLSIQDLKVTIRSKGMEMHAVNSLNLEIPPHSVVGLVGESGCGKSITAMSIMGLLAPGVSISGGRILFDGEEISSYTPAQMRQVVGKSISMIFQEPMTALNPVTRVGKQVEEVLKLHTNLPHAERKKMVVDMFKAVSIPDAEDRYKAYPFQLSGGLRQRVCIAMAMILNPKLLIADEPTTALDVTIEAQILKLMRDLKHNYDTSILMITHNLGIVSELCDAVNVMYLGEIVERAETQRIFDSPLHPYTQGLIHSVPTIEPEIQKLENIPGMVPDLMHVPEGCRFCERCARATARCSREHPELYEREPGHFVRCFLYDAKGEVSGDGE
ncbi:MAG: ABC transporter ATP-binding protein [Clostridia bacterium]|nr:ABC transporter ATP-binding protein [Clostridia bacterium]